MLLCQEALWGQDGYAGHQGIGGPDLAVAAPAGAGHRSLFKLYEAHGADMALMALRF